MMERKHIGSSEIVSTGYDQDAKILEIEFYRDRIYHYEDVPEDIYDGLMNAGESTDKFFAENIQYSYHYTRIK